MNKELLEQIDSMIERLALIELHTGKSEGTLIDKHTLLEIQRELKSQEIKDSDFSEALECLEKLGSKSEITQGCYEFNISKKEELENNEEVDKYINTIKRALLQAKKDKAEIEKLKQENAILHIQLDTFKKIAFKDKSE